MRFPLSPCSSSYANLFNNSQGKSEQKPQFSKFLFSQQDLTGQESPQKGLSILVQPAQSTLNSFLHAAESHTIPHLELIILLFLTIFS